MRQCNHEKPVFSNGKQRKVCFDCAPKAEKRPRKQTEFKSARTATCANQFCGACFMKKLPHERYCGDECRTKAYNRAKQERLRNSQPRPCRWCEVMYVPEYGSLRTHYCTTGCRDAAKRKMRTGGSSRRRAAKYGVAYMKFSKRSVFERDGWKCYLCGDETPQALSGTKSPQAPVLEHVVPVSRGGEHAITNVRCACAKCNNAKGARLLSELDTAQFPRLAYVRALMAADAYLRSLEPDAQLTFKRMAKDIVDSSSARIKGRGASNVVNPLAA